MADTVANWGTPAFEPASASTGGFVPDTSFDETPRTTEGFAELSLNDDNHEQEEAPAAEYTGCRFCKSMQHKARECPDKPDDFGKCFTCGGDHLKVDCPNKPPTVCKICRVAGHDMEECTSNRLWMSYGVIDDLEDDKAWEALQAADKERDLDEIKQATFVYAKSAPGTTLESLEAAFRDQGMNTYLIAKEQPISITHTLVNFQGESGQKFVTTFQFSAKPRRLRQDEGWPSSPEENLERLAQSGFVVDSMVTVCRNCGEIGHTARACTQDKVEIERVEIKCTICDGIGHRARDCDAPRRKPGKPRECRICGSTEHLASECTDKPARACRNCDSTEHDAKDCDQPKDWSRVTCKNCGEKGHGIKRCKKPIVEDDDGGAGGYDRDNGVDEAAVEADTGGW